MKDLVLDYPGTQETSQEGNRSITVRERCTDRRREATALDAVAVQGKTAKNVKKNDGDGM